MAQSRKPIIWIRQVKRNFALTMSRFCTGSRTEYKMSLASLAFWKEWNTPKQMKNALIRIGYPGSRVISAASRNQ